MVDEIQAGRRLKDRSDWSRQDKVVLSAVRSGLMHISSSTYYQHSMAWTALKLQMLIAWIIWEQVGFRKNSLSWMGNGLDACFYIGATCLFTANNVMILKLCTRFMIIVMRSLLRLILACYLYIPKYQLPIASTRTILSPIICDASRATAR